MALLKVFVLDLLTAHIDAIAIPDVASEFDMCMPCTFEKVCQNPDVVTRMLSDALWLRW